jgi:hypothetical protein
MTTLSQTALRAAWTPACGTSKRVRVPLHGRGSVLVRGACYHATVALSKCLERHGYRTRAADTGGYVCRPVTGGGAYSLHAYAIAIDINWISNPYGPTLKTDMPRAMVRDIKAIRTNNGKQVWTWGGDWRGNKDAMHFEIGCSPKDLATGINPRTVPGYTPPAPTPTPTPKPPAPTPAPTPPPTPVPPPEDEVKYYRTPKSMGGNGEVYAISVHFWETLSPEQWKLRQEEDGVKVFDVPPLKVVHMMLSRTPVGEQYVETPTALGGKGEIFALSETSFHHFTPEEWKNRQNEAFGTLRPKKVPPLVVYQRAQTRNKV